MLSLFCCCCPCFWQGVPLRNNSDAINANTQIRRDSDDVNAYQNSKQNLKLLLGFTKNASNDHPQKIKALNAVALIYLYQKEQIQKAEEIIQEMPESEDKQLLLIELALVKKARKSTITYLDFVTNLQTASKLSLDRGLRLVRRVMNVVSLPHMLKLKSGSEAESKENNDHDNMSHEQIDEILTTTIKRIEKETLQFFL